MASSVGASSPTEADIAAREPDEIVQVPTEKPTSPTSPMDEHPLTEVPHVPEGLGLVPEPSAAMSESAPLVDSPEALPVPTELPSPATSVVEGTVEVPTAPDVMELPPRPELGSCEKREELKAVYDPLRKPRAQSGLRPFEKAVERWWRASAETKKEFPNGVGKQRAFKNMKSKPDWLSFSGGVTYLMQHLRKSLGRPQIPELSEYLNRYFKQSKRRKFESMNQYIVRKTEVYQRARQALARVLPDQRASSRWDEASWRSSTWQPSRRSATSWRDDWSNTGQSQRDQSENNEDPWAQRRNNEEEESEDFQDAAEEWDAPSQWHSSYQGQWHNDHYGPWGTQENERWLHETPELLPDFLQGWYLLMDANLTSSERNLVQTAVQGDFGSERIAQELRTQWPEEELRDHEQGMKQASYWQDEVDGEPIGGEGMTIQSLQEEGMNEEGLAMMADAEVQAEEAMAVIERAQRTLREARAKQHQVKMNRQYYKTEVEKYKSKSGPIKCFRCGGNHKIANCPDRQAPRAGEAQKAESAPFVCYARDEAAMVTNQDAMTTEEAVLKGYGIIDGGATKTLGSVHALEAVAAENFRKHSDDRILEIDPEQKPTFGFGNSSRNQCVSTAKVQIQAGDQKGILQVHALEEGQGPVLLSISTLRSLGAIIDFEADLIVFRKLDDRRVIKALRSDGEREGEEIFQALKELGEEPPAQWKNPELKVRLMEVEEELGIDKLRRSRHHQTELMTWVTRLNQETIPVLQKQAMEKIYLLTEPDGQDPMGFGQHASLTYAEVKSQHAGYCTSAQTTASEGQHSLRLGRFVKWLNMEPKDQVKMPHYLAKQYVKSKGETETCVKAEPEPSEAPTSSTQALVEAQHMMTKMMATMEEMKGELQELREERPRKKTEVKSEELTHEKLLREIDGRTQQTDGTDMDQDYEFVVVIDEGSRILATEKHRDGYGNLKESSSIWLVRGRRLIKCCPEQLRPASEREELLEFLGNPEENKAPWNFTRVASALGGNEMDDITGEIPDLATWQRDQQNLVRQNPKVSEKRLTPKEREEFREAKHKEVASWRQWGVKKGDVSGAFLQGREYPNELYCVPCPEILEAMGLGPTWERSYKEWS
ncbi:unnamed protein product [Cladocopium goreaui]|uniref:CCHC-type domain-containing protein n=1 Tax=Cladocopium goreaui TaxID=2562237 RepID=A0A9P1GNI1_9DINO|nr:unnamed protein product [Cladocopium goreaui]